MGLKIYVGAPITHDHLEKSTLPLSHAICHHKYFASYYSGKCSRKALAGSSWALLGAGSCCPRRDSPLVELYGL